MRNLRKSRPSALIFALRFWLAGIFKTASNAEAHRKKIFHLWNELHLRGTVEIGISFHQHLIHIRWGTSDFAPEFLRSLIETEGIGYLLPMRMQKSHVTQFNRRNISAVVHYSSDRLAIKLLASVHEGGSILHGECIYTSEKPHIKRIHINYRLSQNEYPSAMIMTGSVAEDLRGF